MFLLALPKKPRPAAAFTVPWCSPVSLYAPGPRQRFPDLGPPAQNAGGKFTVRAERGQTGTHRPRPVASPKIGAVWDDAGVRERPDVGEVGGVDLGTAGAHAPRDNLGPGGLSVN